MSERPFLVLVPGLLSTDILWQRVAEILSDVVDIHITQQHLRNDNLQAMAESILAETPPTFAIAGASMGGYVALLTKMLGGDRVSHLCLVDSTANLDLEDQQDRREQLKEMAERGDFGGVKKAMIPLFLNEDNQRSISMNAVMDTMAEVVGREGFLQQLGALMQGGDLRAELRKIQCPTLVMCGAQDNFLPVEYSREVTQAIRNSKLVVINDAAHLLPLERPETVAELMRHWLIGDLHMDRKEMTL